VIASARLSWNLRVTPEDQTLIDRAVSASGLTRTDFVLQKSRLAAQELLIGQTWLSVGAEPFGRFAAALDAPPHANEQLRRTMAAPSPW
jgi:uncharacterized protein (DUF1778 family)